MPKVLAGQTMHLLPSANNAALNPSPCGAVIKAMLLINAFLDMPIPESSTVMLLFVVPRTIVV